MAALSKSGSKSSVSKPQSYKIKSGDTLGKIAKKNKTSVKALKTANSKIKNPDKIYAGDTIKIPSRVRPGNEAPPAGTAGGLSDTARRGAFEAATGIANKDTPGGVAKPKTQLNDQMLAKGSRGPEVGKLQGKLKEAGFNTGPVDGIFGPKTQRAVRQYQAKNGLRVDGMVGPNTRGVLNGTKQPVKPGSTPSSPAKPGSSDARLFKAITGQESGGKHTAVNPHSGALGIGQVMPSNVRSWSKEILGYSISPQKFKARPDLQNKIVQGKLSQFYKEGLKATGSKTEAVRYAASKWYSGKGSRRNNYRPQSYKGHRYPSIGSYSDMVLRRFNRVQ
jgi:peptidoglycan hydrolase-like protein with peptidoglycan-binding domain